MFYQGPLSDSKFMSVDAAQFCLCKNTTNCLLSVVDEKERPPMCFVQSVKHEKSNSRTRV